MHEAHSRRQVARGAFIKLLILIIGFYSCKTSSLIKNDEYLLKKNIVKINNSKIEKSALSIFIKQKPNRKILGLFRFHLLIYKIGNIGKETKIKRWFKNTVGEAPVILDTNKTNSTLKQFNLYLNSKGYFNSEIRKEIIRKRKKAKVKYIVETHKPYTIRTVNYNSTDNVLLDKVEKDKENSLIKIGNNFDTDVLEKERERITRNLKNEGYFQFSKEYINYKVDSLLINKELTKVNEQETKNKRQLSITIDIKGLNDALYNKKDSLKIFKHKKFKIDKIFIIPDYKLIKKDTVKYDTIAYYSTGKISKATTIDEEKPLFYFLTKDKLRIKPRTLFQSIFIKEDSYFNSDDIDNTYQSLSSLQNFKFINIDYSAKVKNDSSKNIGYIDCSVRLTRLPKQSFSFETVGTNSGGDLGVAANVGYQNINLLGGAEIFNFKIRGALEAQKILSSGDKVQKNLPFNTYELGADANINIPKFLIPVSQTRFAKQNRPKTIINIGFNFQKRAEYTRYISNFSFGYRWKETPQKTHIINPFEINGINITTDSAFDAKINSLKDQSLINSYKNHLSSGLSYSFIYNTQEYNKLIDFVYIRTNFETAGNSVWLTNKYILNSKKDEEGFYRIVNNRYAQYVKVDIDYRYFKIFDEYNTLAFRLVSGIGVPYLNMNSLPFEKTFFCGGANSIRAWEIRTLGPGSYHDSSNSKAYDKIGDMKLEANIEYRFPLYSYLKGALFVDAGNIWYKNRINNMPGAEFRINRFYKEIALGAGIGFRLDFNFFVIRLDAAVPLNDPSRLKTNTWVAKELTFRDFVLNLGIGYPF